MPDLNYNVALEASRADVRWPARSLGLSMSHAIELIIHDDLKSYTASVIEFLEINEAENSLLLGILGVLKDDPATRSPFMAQVKSNDETIAAAFYSDRNLIVTRGLEPALEVLAAMLMTGNIDVPGVVGSSEIAERFAQTWTKARGCEHLLWMDQGLYRLTRVEWPQGIPGKMRPMTARDTEFVADWILGFHLGALRQEHYSSEEAWKNSEARPQKRMTFVWDVDGTPVAMAGLARPTTRGISVSGVYTPPEYRKRGYATALVAAISQEGLNRGKEFCVLYTDVTNPTSNSIYQKIGYQLVCTSRHFRFEYQTS